MRMLVPSSRVCPSEFMGSNLYGTLTHYHPAFSIRKGKSEASEETQIGDPSSTRSRDALRVLGRLTDDARVTDHQFRLLVPEIPTLLRLAVSFSLFLLSMLTRSSWDLV